MGFGGISMWQLLIILVIVVLLFGTKKLRNIGTDLGGAIKSFKKSMKEEGEEEEEGAQPKQLDSDRVVESATAEKVDAEKNTA